MTCELEIPNSGTRFLIHWNLCAPSGQREQGMAVITGTGGVSSGARRSHDDLRERRSRPRDRRSERRPSRAARPGGPRGSQAANRRHSAAPPAQEFSRSPGSPVSTCSVQVSVSGAVGHRWGGGWGYSGGGGAFGTLAVWHSCTVMSSSVMGLLVLCWLG